MSSELLEWLHAQQKDAQDGADEGYADAAVANRHFRTLIAQQTPPDDELLHEITQAIQSMDLSQDNDGPWIASAEVHKATTRIIALIRGGV